MWSKPLSVEEYLNKVRPYLKKKNNFKISDQHLKFN